MHKHLTLEDRHYIYLEQDRLSKSQIAKRLGVHPSTIGREIARNSGLRGYRYKQAQAKTLQRHKNKPKLIKLSNKTIDLINYYLLKNWSPEQICGYLRRKHGISLHHESIYRYLLKDKRAGGFWYKRLRHQHRKYKKRYGNGKKGAVIPNRVDISMRSEAINNRARTGDWEADTMIGKNHKGCLVTLDERLTKLRLAYPLNSKQAQAVSKAICSLLQPFASVVHSITYDNGKEFAFHEKINQALACNSYFARPYHSWERGQNENANGLLRQYFPKTMELLDISVKDVILATDKLNNRPRKCLNYQTPYEAFFQATGIDARKFAVLHL